MIPRAATVVRFAQALNYEGYWISKSVTSAIAAYFNHQGKNATTIEHRPST
jgi:DNA-binding MurR/RpiR family transcriptional regulator